MLNQHFTRKHALGLLAVVGLIIPTAAFAQNNSVVIKTIPASVSNDQSVLVETAPNPAGCVVMNTNGRPVSRTITISKQSQSVNGSQTTSQVVQSSVSTSSDSGRNVFCALPQGVPGLP